MKILLIDPYLSSRDEYGNLSDLSNVIPSLGLAYVAASLKQNGFDVKVVDCSVEGISTSQLVNVVRTEAPDVVGFTATVMSIQSALSSLKAIKEHFPGMYAILGGPQVTALPHETMESSEFDAAVIGEGEITTVELLKRIQQGSKDMSGIPGILFRKANKLEFTGSRAHIQDLSALPKPAFELFPPFSKYQYSAISTLKYPCAHMITSRGCPFSCRFCNKSVTGSAFRSRRPAEVMEEIVALVEKYGVKEIKFFDDTFTYQKENVYEFCDLLDKSKLNMTWSCVAHAACVDRDLLRRMKRSGCWQIVFGMESGNQGILDAMCKPLTLSQSRQAAKLACEAGMNVRATFIFGLPGETLSTLQDTLNFAKAIQLDTVSFYVFCPFPGSELFRELKAKGEILHTDYLHYQTIVDPRKAKPVFVPQGIAQEDFLRFVEKAYKDYYLRPAYIYSQIRQIKSFGHARRFWRCAKAL